MDSKPLKLRAKDAADLKIISALLQDALLPVGDMDYRQGEKRFVMIVNRFRWEHEPEPPGPAEEEAEGEDVAFAEVSDQPHYERINAGLTVDRVSKARYRGFDAREKGRILNLLSMDPIRGGLLITFAEDAEIFLETKTIRCHLEDLGEAWPTRWRPDHSGSEDGAPD